MNTLRWARSGFEVFLGALTFTGSLMAFGKLQGCITGAPMTYRARTLMNIAASSVAAALLVGYLIDLPERTQLVFYAMCGAGPRARHHRWCCRSAAPTCRW